ncbi:hypothetical protein ACFFQF_19000 [Haladaptatus pallidirubidus]|uniref:hypothetical protein n=1 Tax=Haladaptatus pallidirubidus TaxID=1008152 RepID=UPI0035EC63EC
MSDGLFSFSSDDHLEIVFVFSEVELCGLLSTLSVPILTDELRNISELLGFVVFVKIGSPTVIREIEE